MLVRSWTTIYFVKTEDAENPIGRKGLIATNTLLVTKSDFESIKSNTKYPLLTYLVKDCVNDVAETYKVKCTPNVPDTITITEESATDYFITNV